MKFDIRGANGEISPPLQGYADFETWLNSVREPEQIAAMARAGLSDEKIRAACAEED